MALFVPLLVTISRSSPIILVILLALVPLVFWMFFRATWFMVASLVIVSIPRLNFENRTLLQVLYVFSILLIHHLEVASGSRSSLLEGLTLRSMLLTVFVLAFALFFSRLLSLVQQGSVYGGSYVLLIIGLGLTVVIVYVLSKEDEKIEPAVLMIRTWMQVGPSYSFELSGFYERGVAVRVVDSGRRTNRVLSFSIEWDGDPPDELIVTNGSYEKTLKKRGEMKGNGKRVFLYT